MTRRLATALLALTLAAGCSGDPAGRSEDAGATGAQAAEETTTAVPSDRPPRPAAGPRSLAARVTTAEDVVRGGATGPEVAEAGFALQVLYRQLGRTPQWDRRVLAAVPGRYRATVRAQVHARRQLRSMHYSLAPTLPDWRIVDPAPVGRLARFYREGERTFGVPWEILAAINLVETGMGRIRGTSVAGAQGPMQFMPATWAQFGRGDIDDPRDAILAAARYLAHNGGGRGAIDVALYRYNNHPAYVAAVKDYASIIADDPRSLRGFYHWQIIYLAAVGDVWLPVGYEQRRKIRARDYVERHPERLLTEATG